jgi:hypothetical protein
MHSPPLLPAKTYIRVTCCQANGRPCLPPMRGRDRECQVHPCESAQIARFAHVARMLQCVTQRECTESVTGPGHVRNSNKNLDYARPECIQNRDRNHIHTDRHIFGLAAKARPP